MSEPIYYCETCGMVRECRLHMRAEFPPDAAKAWLRRQHEKYARCPDFQPRYRAGIAMRGRFLGQSEATDE